MSNPQAIPVDVLSGESFTSRIEEAARPDPFSQLLHLLPDGVLCFNRSWQITFANTEARRTTSIHPHHIGTGALWDLFPHLIGTEIERQYRFVMETGIPAHFEYLSRHRDIWRDIHVLPTEEGIAVCLRDITDRKGAELLHHSASRRLLQVLEATTDCVASINREHRFTFLNRAARELLAIKGDLTGRNFWQEFPLASQQYREHYSRAMHDRIASEIEDFYPEPLNKWLAIQIRPSDEGVVLFFRDVTSRREARLALRQQSDLLSVVQQNARVATWDADLATGKITWGIGSYPVFGHPFSQLPNLHSFLNHIAREYITLISDQVKRTRQTGEMIVLDFPIRAEDGSQLWIECRCRAHLVNGVAERLRGLSIDITDRKRGEEALAASQARYRILADLNPQAIWMGDSDGRITYANQILLDSIGLTLEQLACETWLPHFHPDDQDRVHDIWHQCVTAGTDFDIEARMYTVHKPKPHWYWLRAQPVRDDAGNITSWLGINIDIDDRKTFAETLQKRQEQTERQRAELETIYRTSPIGLALFDPVEFRYLRVNDRQVETLGLPVEQILGRRITDLVPFKGIDELFRQVAAGGTIRNHVFEGELPTRPGEHRYWNVNYSPVWTADGKVEAIAAVIQEITHQKKAEQALIQSEKLAAVGRLASSISHEINNPLESITNLLYLIRNASDLPPALSAYIRTAQSELSRVCQIATQTLRFHRQAVSATRVTPQELVSAVLDLYQGRLLNSGIEVATFFHTSNSILCFENDIRQVLNNLIANAIDAMRQGGHLIVRARESADYSCGQHRKGIRITIADTGHGMTPAVRARLFEPFYTTKELNGTGLGLWISSGIVERHQGTLTLRSSTHPAHHGTAFSLFLPCRETLRPTDDA
ncbi:MAG TPA: PAS domain-containing protein [Edaphobacter sp.]